MTSYTSNFKVLICNSTEGFVNTVIDEDGCVIVTYNS